MRQKSNSTPASSETLVRNIRRATRKHHAAVKRRSALYLTVRGLTGKRHRPAIRVERGAPQMVKRKVPRTDNPWRDSDINLRQYIRGQSDHGFPCAAS